MKGKFIIQGYSEVRAALKLIQPFHLTEYQAKIYVMANGKAVLVPNISSRVVVFESFEEANSYVLEHGIPIEYDSPFSRDRKLLADLEKAKEVYFSFLSEELQMVVVPSLDNEYLNILASHFALKLDTMEFEERWNKFAVPLGIFVGSCLTLSSKYKWLKDTIIMINPNIEWNIQTASGDRKFIWVDVRGFLKYPETGLSFISSYISCII